MSNLHARSLLRRLLKRLTCHGRHGGAEDIGEGSSPKLQGSALPVAWPRIERGMPHGETS